MSADDDALARRAKALLGLGYVASWDMENVPPGRDVQMFFSGVYRHRGFLGVVAVNQLDANGNEMPNRLDVYAKLDERWL